MTQRQILNEEQEEQLLRGSVPVLHLRLSFVVAINHLRNISTHLCPVYPVVFPVKYLSYGNSFVPGKKLWTMSEKPFVISN